MRMWVGLVCYYTGWTFNDVSVKLHKLRPPYQKTADFINFMTVNLHKYFILRGKGIIFCYILNCILIVSLYYSCLCVVYVFLDAATLTEVFPCFFLSCKTNARV